MGERLHRKLQRSPARRTLGRGDLLFPEGGSDCDRELAPSLQCSATARVPWLPTASARGLRTSARRVAVCALGIRSDGHAHADVETWAKLTFESDHSRGADQGARGQTSERAAEFLDVWRRYATNIVAYEAIPCGHYIQEEMPEKVLDHFTRFFGL